LIARLLSRQEKALEFRCLLEIQRAYLLQGKSLLMSRSPAAIVRLSAENRILALSPKTNR
jgi:hypothetical protein